MKPSNQEAAIRNRTTHSFIPGQGYIDHGSPPALPAGPHASKQPCKPAGKAASGSLHILKTSAGSEMEMRWKDGFWEHPVMPLLKGNRLAHSPAHLGQAGWSYVGKSKKG